MKVVGIVAVSDNNVMGDSKTNAIPWKIKGEQTFFKDTTWGCPIIMGRKTWDSIPKKFRPLVGRINIVLSKTILNNDGYFHFSNLKEAIDWTIKENCPNIFIIGGGEIYNTTFDLVDRIFLTRVTSENEIVCDTFLKMDRLDQYFKQLDECRVQEIIGHDTTTGWQVEKEYSFQFQIFDRV